MGLRNRPSTDRLALLDRIDRSRNGEPKVANNTTAERGWEHHFDGTPVTNDNVVIRYHGHPIVVLHADNSITLDDCGWRTSTTKERLNLYAPYGFGIWQEKFVWYYRTADNAAAQPWPGRLRVTRDGDLWQPHDEHVH